MKNTDPGDDILVFSKEQAIQAMKDGQRMTHRFFMDDEYICMEDDVIVSQDGYKHPYFWELRTHPDWLKGWQVYKEPVKNK